MDTFCSATKPCSKAFCVSRQKFEKGGKTLSDSKNAGYSKLGFSPSFGCCSHFAICDMGRGDCVYAERDPAAMKGCRAWQRKHSIPAPNPKERREDRDKDTESVEMVQLSLF